MINSDASIHAISKRDFFASYTSDDFSKVRMGNDRSTKAIDIRDVHLETKNGYRLILKNICERTFHYYRNRLS